MHEQVQNLEEVRQRARQIREWQAQEHEQEHSEGRQDEEDYEDDAENDDAEEGEEEPPSHGYGASNGNSPYVSQPQYLLLTYHGHKFR